MITVFLILELDQPFAGLIRSSGAQAHAQLIRLP
jgi:hypothetical protein